MEKGIFSELNEKLLYGKKTQKRIAEFLINYEGDFRKLKITDIANSVCTSNATIVRFAQDMGYLGFPEMKIELENQARIFQGNDYSKGEKESQRIHIMSLITSFEMTSSVNTHSQILNFVDKIKSSKNVDIYAQGETNITAQDFALKLIRIGFVATAHQDSHTKHFVATNSTTETLAIGISYSGTSTEVFESLSLAKTHGATTFLIAKEGTKKPEYIDYMLNIQCSESGARVFSTVSRLTILYLLDIVYLELIETNSEFYHDKLNKNRLKRSR
jgi:RpiR family carbohydrate utilization transcriptional regulator